MAPRSDDDFAGLLGFLHSAERLKMVTRSASTSDGQPESVAAHTWRLALLALLVAETMPGIDVGRLLSICIVHDLGEAIGGDVSAPEQARRKAAGEDYGKAGQERQDLASMAEQLPQNLRDHVLALWDEYELAQSAEGRLAKGLDKLETILQHTQGQNPPGFDYRFNLEYGRAYTTAPPVVAALRRMLDAATEARAVAADQT